MVYKHDALHDCEVAKMVVDQGINDGGLHFNV
jgi:hypothetical protein